MEKFCWVCDVGSWKILWLWFWICGNLFVHGHEHVEIIIIIFFYGYLGHVGIFSWWLFWTCRKFFDCVWLWEKFGSCVWTCEKNFIVVKFLVGALILNFFFFFFFVGIFRHVILVMEIFLDMWLRSWNNGLNFYLVEPQELR